MPEQHDSAQTAVHFSEVADQQPDLQAHELRRPLPAEPQLQPIRRPLTVQELERLRSSGPDSVLLVDGFHGSICHLTCKQPVTARLASRLVREHLAQQGWSRWLQLAESGGWMWRDMVMSPDGVWCRTCSLGTVEAVAEFKCPLRGKPDGAPALQYLLQVILQMAATGARSGYIVIWKEDVSYIYRMAAQPQIAEDFSAIAQAALQQFRSAAKPQVPDGAAALHTKLQQLQRSLKPIQVVPSVVWSK